MPLSKPLGKSKSHRLNTRSLAAFKRMEILAHSVVEGFLTGLHKSPFKGFAIEFEEHRHYVRGDDLKHLDWKLLGKVDRYYIKQYEEDTSLRAFMILDSSGSMSYSSNELTKLEYGRYIAGVMTYILMQQQDSVGLVTCDTDIQRYLPPRATRPHFKRIMDTLDALEPQNETQLSEVLHKMAQRIKRRALIIIISDLFDDPDKLSLALSHFAHKKHEVIVFRTLDRREVDFDFNHPTRFEDLETDGFQQIDPIQLRKEYKRVFDEHRNKIKKTCFERRIDFQEIFTDEPFERRIAQYLMERLRRTK
ncbi:MAG: DUF58 domain-containing protein [Kiritimatiellia bacterium]